MSGKVLKHKAGFTETPGTVSNFLKLLLFSKLHIPPSSLTAPGSRSINYVRNFYDFT